MVAELAQLRGMVLRQSQLPSPSPTAAAGTATPSAASAATPTAAAAVGAFEPLSPRAQETSSIATSPLRSDALGSRKPFAAMPHCRAARRPRNHCKPNLALHSNRGSQLASPVYPSLPRACPGKTQRPRRGLVARLEAAAAESARQLGQIGAAEDMRHQVGTNGDSRSPPPRSNTPPIRGHSFGAE